MPYWKCNQCHHEFESSEQRKCDWCGSESHILEEKTPLEKCNFGELLERMKVKGELT